MQKKVIFLKSGPYAFHPVYGPVLHCHEGEEATIDGKNADALESDGWAEVVEVISEETPADASQPETDDDENPEGGSDDDDSGNDGSDADETTDDDGGNTSPEGLTDADRIPPWMREGWDPENKDAKKCLQDWSVLVFGTDLVDMRKSLPKIITKLEKALEA